MAAAIPGRRSVLCIALLLLSGCSFTAALTVNITAPANNAEVLCQAGGREFNSSKSGLICSLGKYPDVIPYFKLVEQCPESVPDNADALILVTFNRCALLLTLVI
jgi:hypothetical protein